jgi:hypothetical protein
MSSEVREGLAAQPGPRTPQARTSHSAIRGSPLFATQLFQNPEIWIIAEVKSLRKQKIENSTDNRNLASSCPLSDIDHSKILIRTTIKLQVNS